MPSRRGPSVQQSMDTLMTIEPSQTMSGEAQLLTLHSTLRIGDIGDFKQACDAVLSDAPQSPIVFDASAVEFIDAAALQYLAALARYCADAARGFEIRSPSASFSGAASVSGYARLLGATAV